MKNMKKEGIALLFHIESVLLVDLLSLDERIAHQRVCIQILMVQMHGCDLAVLVGGVIVNALSVLQQLV